jgi:hypothetical protein
MIFEMMCDVGIFSSYAVKWLWMATFFSVSPRVEAATSKIVWYDHFSRNVLVQLHFERRYHWTPPDVTRIVSCCPSG